MVQAFDDSRPRRLLTPRTGGGATTGRVPPHNLEAEESVLGAMLLSRDAIAIAMETCKAEDFYKTSHGYIFQAITPSVGNAEYYAKIVEELALLRRLVGEAGEISELGYSVPEDVSEVLDRAESLVFDVAQRRVVDTMTPLEDLLGATLDHLEQLFSRSETVTGLATGYTDLDEQLAGLQPSNLVVVGARPAMGKTC